MLRPPQSPPQTALRPLKQQSPPLPRVLDPKSPTKRVEAPEPTEEEPSLEQVEPTVPGKVTHETDARPSEARPHIEDTTEDSAAMSSVESTPEPQEMIKWFCAYHPEYFEPSITTTVFLSIVI